MARSKMLFVWALLICTAVFLVSTNGCGGGGGGSQTGPPPPTQKIQHVVIIFQENRTPDNLFQDPKLIAAGADIQNFGIDSTGERITLTPAPLASDFDPSHD